MSLENKLNMIGKEQEVIIVCAAEELSSVYEREVLEHNRIPELLRLSVEWIDDTAECHYDTGDCQSLEAYYQERKMALDEFRNIMESIQEVLAQMEKYLLDPEAIALNPDLIFFRNNSKKLVFCYLLGQKKSRDEESQMLMDWIARKIDYRNQELVLAVYGLKSEDLASVDEWRWSFDAGASESQESNRESEDRECAVRAQVESYSDVVKEESAVGSAWKGILTKLRKWFTVDESKNKGKTG